MECKNQAEVVGHHRRHHIQYLGAPIQVQDLDVADGEDCEIWLHEPVHRENDVLLPHDDHACAARKMLMSRVKKIEELATIDFVPNQTRRVREAGLKLDSSDCTAALK